MKKYISAILIDVLLFQFCGCFSMREMTFEELKYYEGQDDIVIKTNQNKVLINRKSSKTSSMNWEASDSLITIKIQEQLTLEYYNKLNSQDLNKSANKEIEIKYDEIKSVEIEEFDLMATVWLTAGIGAVLVVALAYKDYKEEGWFNWK